MLHFGTLSPIIVSPASTEASQVAAIAVIVVAVAFFVSMVTAILAAVSRKVFFTSTAVISFFLVIVGFATAMTYNGEAYQDAQNINDKAVATWLDHSYDIHVSTNVAHALTDEGKQIAVQYQRKMVVIELLTSGDGNHKIPVDVSTKTPLTAPRQGN